MEAEKLLTLFDCYWFEQEILKKHAHPSNSEANPSQTPQEPPNPSLPTISTRSMDELVSFPSESSSNNSVSPSSVLLPRRLHTIFSGKEVKETEEEEDEEEEGEGCRTREEGGGEIETLKSLSGGERRRNKIREHRKKKLERGFSKSLSDLEFEELRGFMDLGFVFLEEDKGSEFLTTILPGLQRMGSEEGEEEDEKEKEKEKEREDGRKSSVDGFGVSRPYLSEVWEVSEREKLRRRRENKKMMMMSWENLPSVGNKIDMKGYLKTWAHSVASSVR